MYRCRLECRRVLSSPSEIFSNQEYCGSRRELKRVYLQWTEESLSLVKVWRSPTSIYHEWNQLESDQLRSWWRIGRGEFILCVKSQPLQPDIVLWQKGKLVYQILQSPSSTTGSLDITAFPSTVYICAPCRQLYQINHSSSIVRQFIVIILHHLWLIYFEVLFNYDFIHAIFIHLAIITSAFLSQSQSVFLS